MMKMLLSTFMMTLLFVFLIFPAAAKTVYYDKDGHKIDKAEYKQIINKRKPIINEIRKEGYPEHGSLPDPILLRKKRIEQWEAYRKSE